MDTEQRIADLERALAGAEGGCAGASFRSAEQMLRIADLEAEHEKLRRVVEKLSKRLGLNSSNSSMPPSTDRGRNAKRNAKKAKRKKSKRKRGGQMGHPGHRRALLPAEQVDATFEHFPDACTECGESLPAETDPDALRHQVTELPPIQPHTTEHRLHAVSCGCGCVTRAVLPEHVPVGAFGPRLVSMVALLTGLYRLSKRNTVRALRELFGVKMSLGSVSQCERLLSRALAEPHRELHEHIMGLPLVHADETSWQQGHKRHWLWVACTTTVAFFMIQAGRTTVCAKRLLGESPWLKAILVTDRLASYGFWPGRRQVCWAHLARLFQGFAENKRGTYAQIYGSQLQTLTKQMFQWWGRVRDGTLARSTFQRKMRPLRNQLEDILAQAAACPCLSINGKAKSLLSARDALWTFVFVEGVECTNNQAERDLRHAVIHRRTSFGTDSSRGSRFIERMLSTVECLRKQQRDVLDFLIEAHAAHRDQRRAPSLVPLDEV